MIRKRSDEDENGEQGGGLLEIGEFHGDFISRTGHFFINHH